MPGIDMSPEEIALSLFTFCNAARIVGYLPQIICTLRDKSGGASTSLASWSMFLTANLSVVPYAILNAKDPLMAAIFGANAVCCVAIVAGTLWKRRQRSQMGARRLIGPVLIAEAHRVSTIRNRGENAAFSAVHPNG
jgi:uncharacterized protein with PQ loop repeat